MQCLFILVEPARAAHVGAAARALKTMGFAQLVLVNSDLHEADEARWVAHGATDILEHVQVYPDLVAVRARCDLLVGTTARERGSSRHYHTPEALSGQMAQQVQTVGTAGIVFGREARGLTNDELALCDIWSHVPLAGEFPSLNLGQAVMVYSYALSALHEGIGLQAVPADAGQLQHLKQRVMALLAGQVPDCDPKLLEWLAERMPCFSDRDVKMAHQLLNRLAQPLKDHP